MVKSFYAKKIQETCGRDSADEDLRRSEKVQVRRHNVGSLATGARRWSPVAVLGVPSVLKEYYRLDER